MHKLVLLSALISILNTHHSFGQNLLEVPVNLEAGIGPFQLDLNDVALSAKSTQSLPVILPKLKGIPIDWQQIKTDYIIVDHAQFLYQMLYAHKIVDTVSLENFLSDHQLKLDTSVLSPEPLRCFLSFITGKDSQGKFVARFDSNYDGDVSDETDYQIPVLKAINQDITSNLTHLSFSFQWVQKDEIVEKQIPILLCTNAAGNDIYKIIPMYGHTELFNMKLYINFGFSFNPEGQKADLMVVDQASDSSTYQKSQLIKLSKRIYRNRGLDIQSQLLLLGRVESSYALWTNHSEYYAPDFVGKEVNTNEEITLSELKGKFIFVEFWGSWCGPCISKLPKLKQAYHELKQENVVFLGIAEDNKKPLKKAIERHEIPWPNILSDNANKIIEKYNISKYPSNFLISPDGKFLAQDLDSELLFDKILEHIEIYTLVNNGPK